MRTKVEMYRAAVLSSLVAVSCLLLPANTCAEAKSLPAPSALTLQHLRNATYQVPDLLCGYSQVKLTDGSGQNNGVKATFGRAVFGNLTPKHVPMAVVHLAYRTPELGWLQELVFIEQKGGKLVQTAEYILDDSAELKALSIKDGQVQVLTTGNDHYQGGQADKLTKIAVANVKQGCMLKVNEFSANSQTGETVESASMAPYLAQVEERIGRCWQPSNKDRGEHVVIMFTITPSGQVANVCIDNSSEVATADEAAIAAVTQAAPFPPLPESAGQPLKVCLEFQASVSVKQ